MEKLKVGDDVYVVTTEIGRRKPLEIRTYPITKVSNTHYTYQLSSWESSKVSIKPKDGDDTETYRTKRGAYGGSTYVFFDRLEAEKFAWVAANVQKILHVLTERARGEHTAYANAGLFGRIASIMTEFGVSLDEK